MPRINQLRKADTLVALEEYLDRPEIYVVRSEYLVHERSENGAPCECCGSRLATVESRIPLVEFAFRVSDGARVYRHTVDAETWEAISADAVNVYFPVRCSEITLPIVDGQGVPVWLILGGGRAQKTHSNAYRQAVVWLRRGGPGTRFWVVGPELKHAHIVKTKLFVGEQKADHFNPPIFPHVLVTGRIPDGPHGEQLVHVIDGSTWELRHGRSAAAIKGDAPTDMLITEGGEIRSPEFFVVAGQRMIDSGGTLGIDSTPVPKTPLEVIFKASREEDADEEKAQAAGKKFQRQYSRAELSSSDNPWTDPAIVARMRKAAAAISPQLARRDFDGEWVGDHAFLFGDDWDAGRHTFDTLHQRPETITKVFAEKDLVDVTRQASRRHFGPDGTDWVIGVDVNRNPHTHVICKLFEWKARPGVRGLLVFDKLRVWDSDSWHSAKRLQEYQRGWYQGAGVSIDATAVHSNQHAAHTGGRETTPLKDYRSLGFDCRPPDKSRKRAKAINPLVRESTNLLKHLMREDLFLVNASLCREVVKAITEQQDRGDGNPVKESGRYSDREIAAWTDSLRYISWPLLLRDVEARLIGRKAESTWTVI